MTPLVQGERGPSGTKIWFSIFSAIVCVRFLLADVSAFGISVGAFPGEHAWLLLGVFGGTYAARRYTEAVKPKPPSSGA